MTSVLVLYKAEKFCWNSVFSQYRMLECSKYSACSEQCCPGRSMVAITIVYDRMG